MKRSVFTYIAILSVIGILLAVYLLWEQIYHPTFQPCRINSTVNCDAIISGAVAKTLGVPTPLYGLIGYIVIFFSALYQKPRLLLNVSAFGLLFCMYIAYRELFELRVICPVCIGCQIIMISIFSMAVINVLKQKKHDHK